MQASSQTVQVIQPAPVSMGANLVDRVRSSDSRAIEDDDGDTYVGELAARAPVPSP